MSIEQQEESFSRQETFISHLIELRTRLMRSIIAVLVLFFCLLPWSGEIYDFLAKPMTATLPDGVQMIATGVVTPFIVPIKVTMLVAFVLALPWVLYQVWAFIAPGLYAHERRTVLPLVFGSTMLFFAGMAFCYYFVLGMAFSFIAKLAPESVRLAPDISQYLSFVMTMFIAFGITFEVPVVVILLAKAGVVSVEKLREVRPYVIVGAFVIAAVITPPDVVSQIMLAVPMCLLYEAGVFIAAASAKRKSTAGAESNAVVPVDSGKSG